MHLWMSGEIQNDVADAYRVARVEVERSINDKLKALSLETSIEKWAFIAIIRPDDHPDYSEIKTKDARRKIIEFRLKIDHTKFLRGTAEQRVQLISTALQRSVSLMSGLGITRDDCIKLAGLFESVQTIG